MDFVIVGCGSIGTKHAASLEKLNQRIVAVADPTLPDAVDEAKYGPVRSYSDPNECIRAESKERAVIIASPSKYHGAQALLAVDNGCRALLVEKPMTIRPDEALELVNACNTYGVKAAVGHNFRFHRANSDYIQKATRGQSPIMIWAASDPVKTWPSYQRADSYLKDPENGGILYTAASHCIDTALSLNGPAAVVLCVLRGALHEPEQSTVVRLFHRAGGTSIIYMTWSDRRYSVLVYLDTHALWAFDMYGKILEPSMEMMHYWEMQAFLRYISGGKRGLLCSPEEGHDTVRVLAAAIRSNAVGEAVHIEAGPTP